MPMNTKERQDLVAHWLLLQRSHEERAGYDDLSWVVQRIWDLCDNAPNDAFEFIVAALEEDGSNAAMAILSAGPLEALLRRHGPKIIVRVERRARRDPTFVRLLGHVWKDSMSLRIWERVQAARNRRPLAVV